MSHKEPDALGYQVLRSIRRIVRQVSRYSRQVGRDTGLGVPQMLCLRAIEEAPAHTEVTVAYVADIVHLSRSTISPMVEKLLQAGLVTRERSHVDRRRVHLGLTPAGRSKLASMPEPLEARFVARLADLPDDERSSILSALEQVVELMGAEELDAAPLLLDGAGADT
jgi:DNA-binding MarR family transcriptional regulator